MTLRCIAEALGQAGWHPLLVSAVGGDLAGEGLIVGCEAVRTHGNPTTPLSAREDL